MNRLFDFFNAVAKDTAVGVKGYLKSRVIIMAIVFLILSIGLVTIESPMPYLFAFIIALIDIVPLLGAGIIMIPWGIISYFGGNIELGKGILILYVILTILKQVIEPKVLGKQIGLSPIYTFIVTIIGSVVFGPIGLIIGPIIAITIKSIVKNRNTMNKDK
jgi:predicted PurR-regulated permease PerM